VAAPRKPASSGTGRSRSRAGRLRSSIRSRFSR
jgi:hypothetical protein